MAEQKKKPKTKGEALTTKRDFGPGKTEAMAARDKARKEQTAPGTDYKAKRAARKKAAAGGFKTGKAPDKLAAGKARIAKMASITAEARKRRKARSPMPTMGSR